MGLDEFGALEGETPTQYVLRTNPGKFSSDRWLLLRELAEEFPDETKRRILLSEQAIRNRTRNDSDNPYAGVFKYDFPETKRGLRVLLNLKTLELFCHETWGDVEREQWLAKKRASVPRKIEDIKNDPEYLKAKAVHEGAYVQRMLRRYRDGIPIKVYRVSKKR